MKKSITIISTICLFALLIMIIPFLNVKAEGNYLSLEGVNVSEKSTSVGIEKLDSSNNEVENTMFFNKVGDFINYEVTVKNNSEEDVTIKEIVDDNTSENIKYEYPDSSGKVIAAGTTDSFHIKAVYVKAASSNNLTNNPVNFAVHYAEGHILPITLNANTADPVLISILLFFLSVLVFVILFIRGKKYAHYSLLLALAISITIPFATKADSFLLNIKINNEVKVKSVSHIKPGPDVCLQMHKLAANADLTYAVHNDYSTYEKELKKIMNNNVQDKGTNILHLSKATPEQYNSVKDNLNEINIISTDDSEIKSYVWFDNGTIYYYSAADTIFLNPDSSYLFSWLTKLETIDLSGFDSTNVTTMEAMFYYDNTMTEIDLTSLYTGNVTNMSALLNYCHNLSYIDVSSLVTSKVTDMSYMFMSCYSATDINTLGIDTSNVTNMSYMFSKCGNYENINLNHLDTSKVQNMSCMFYDNLAKGIIDMSRIDTSSVTDMRKMFGYCELKEHIYVDNFDTSNVTNMQSMFEECMGLLSLDLSSFNTKNVTNMDCMFFDDFCLESLILGDFNNEKVENMLGMFGSCSALTELDLSNFKTPNVVNIRGLFSGNYSLEKIYSNEDFVLDNANTADIFGGCTSLVGGAGTAYDSNHIGMEYARIDEGPSNPGYFTRKDN